MTLTELNTILSGITGFGASKVAYRQFPIGAAPALPFICFFETRESSFAADGINYSNAKNVTVELYTAKKDETTEALVESAITTNQIYWTKEEQWLDDERCFFVVYSITI